MHGGSQHDMRVNVNNPSEIEIFRNNNLIGQNVNVYSASVFEQHMGAMHNGMGTMGSHAGSNYGNPMDNLPDLGPGPHMDLSFQDQMHPGTTSSSFKHSFHRYCLLLFCFVF